MDGIGKYRGNTEHDATGYRVAKKMMRLRLHSDDECVVIML